MKQTFDNSEDAPRAGPRAGRLRGVAIVIGLLASAGLVWQSSQAAFTATTGNAGNEWEAGEVALTNNRGAAMFTTAAKVKPDDPLSQCIDVTYQGNLATAGVRIYTAGKTEADGAADGAVLDAQLQMDIAIGDSNDTCALQGVASWTVLTGPTDTINTLVGYTGWGTALATAWSPSTAGTSRAFLFTHELPTSVNVDLAQGDTVGLNFVWETQNS